MHLLSGEGGVGGGGGGGGGREGEGKIGVSKSSIDCEQSLTFF